MVGLTILAAAATFISGSSATIAKAKQISYTSQELASIVESTDYDKLSSVDFGDYVYEAQEQEISYSKENSLIDSNGEAMLQNYSLSSRKFLNIPSAASVKAGCTMPIQSLGNSTMNNGASILQKENLNQVSKDALNADKNVTEKERYSGGPFICQSDCLLVHHYHIGTSPYSERQKNPGNYAYHFFFLEF